MALILFDVDGTLKPRLHNIPKSTFKAIEKLRQNGHIISIASGRGDDELQSILEKLNITSYVAYGGSKVVVDKKILKNIYFENETIYSLCNYFEDKRIPYFMYNEKQSFSSYLPKYIRYIFILIKPLLTFGFFSKDSTISFYIKNITNVKKMSSQKLKEQPIKKIIFFSRKEGEKPLFHLGVQKRLFVNLVEFEVKDQGIDILKQALHQNETIVFGDGYNDISMFQYADISIAMGNAKQTLKELADYVTTDSHKDGIFNACEKYQYFK